MITHARRTIHGCAPDTMALSERAPQHAVAGACTFVIDNILDINVLAPITRPGRGNKSDFQDRVLVIGSKSQASITGKLPIWTPWI